MRLIDADELVRNILSQTIMNETDAKIMDRYLYCINNQSTAYDIDKVVEKIKDLMWFYEDCTKYGNKDAEQQEKSYGTTLNYEVSDFIEEIIDIVKAGGKNESI